ncbi:MAG: hypothetical protein LBE20_06220 [Deltaproteobacteria bacterium]|jgi:D-alanine-D-alanine ligase|nr:hypothetical protein [Deltaproteobacteria bacterium]
MGKILILYDVIPEQPRIEQQDNLDEARHVEKAILELGNYEYLGKYPVSLDLQKTKELLRELKPDLIFNLVESLNDNDYLGTILPAFLETEKIKYTGSSTGSLLLSSNKVWAKQIMRANNLPTITEDYEVGHNLYVIKSITEHCSYGMDDTAVVSVKSQAELDLEIHKRSQLINSYCFAEQYLDGREFNVTLLNGRVITMSEILYLEYPENKPKIYNYIAKWEDHSFESLHTIYSHDFSKKDQSLLEKMKKIAERCWQILNIDGYARVDFRTDSQDNPYILEINTNPGIAEDGDFGKTLKAFGLTYNWAINEIIKNALNPAPPTDTPVVIVEKLDNSPKLACSC